mmetsp:Transcript_37736/g.90957  ORF Transcript_37736/g.90957 Transcript_37736/m.90957 type:complete len:105 (+) Transcript_37736:2032-2346(+)
MKLTTSWPKHSHLVNDLCEPIFQSATLTTECKTLVPLDRKRLKILIPTYVKAVHFQFEIEFPRRFLHMGRRGPTDGETGRSEEEEEEDEDESAEDDEINRCDGI